MISIIVPVYNAEKHLEKCLNSILNQTFTDFELILINDGSTDKSNIICENFAEKDSRISLINQENKGISSARNLGIKLAKKPYLAFIDADDWIETIYLEVLYNLIITHNADISICNHIVAYKNEIKKDPKHINEKTHIYSKNEALSLLLRDKEIRNFSWGKLYKTTLFEGIEYPEQTFYEDIYTTYLLFDQAKKVAKTNKALLYYVQHDSNATSAKTISSKKNFDAYNGFQKQLDFVKANSHRLIDVSKIEIALAKNFYTLKKSLILEYLLDSELFTEQDVVFNKIMIKAIKNINAFEMGLISYLKYYLSVHNPKLFLNYLKLKTKKN